MVRSFLVYELILLLYSINNIVFQPLYQILDTSQSYLGVCVLKFKLPIVNDSIEYNNEQNKSDGYSLKDGKKLSALNRSPESTSRPFMAINFSYIELI